MVCGSERVTIITDSGSFTVEFSQVQSSHDYNKTEWELQCLEPKPGTCTIQIGLRDLAEKMMSQTLYLIARLAMGKGSGYARQGCTISFSGVQMLCHRYSTLCWLTLLKDSTKSLHVLQDGLAESILGPIPSNTSKHKCRAQDIAAFHSQGWEPVKIKLLIKLEPRSQPFSGRGPLTAGMRTLNLLRSVPRQPMGSAHERRPIRFSQHTRGSAQGD